MKIIYYKRDLKSDVITPDWDRMASNVTCCSLENLNTKAKQRCVMGVGMCLYAQLVQTKNKQCKSAIILQCYHRNLWIVREL